MTAASSPPEPSLRQGLIPIALSNAETALRRVALS
jgi:hypothetical protein